MDAGVVFGKIVSGVRYVVVGYFSFVLVNIDYLLFLVLDGNLEIEVSKVC